MNETKINFISTKEIQKSCDIKTDDLGSQVNYLPDLNKIFENCTMYVRTSQINHLSQRMDEIKHKFILVSGDADEEVYNDIFQNETDFLTFINNDKIIHWFSQNCTINHEKITRLPIGLDYHSNKTSLPQEQEQVLTDIMNNVTTPFNERINKCYINFGTPPDYYRYKYDRDEALNSIPDTIVFKEKENQARDICWQNQTKYAFVVSPFGNGLDCHRTWEALVLGCIPIIRSSGMDSLFDGLPVLFVSSWSDVTQELLDTIIEKFKNMDFEYEKLELNYWTHKINSYKKNVESFANYDTSYDNNIYKNNILFFLLIFIVLLFILKLFVSGKKQINKNIFCIFTIISIILATIIVYKII
jgi:hypothetical protein